MKKVFKIIGMIILGIIVLLILIKVIDMIWYSSRLPKAMITKEWRRETKSDDEYIVFTKKGGYAYYCSCGNPVGSSDLCEEYDYNRFTKTIRLKCDGERPYYEKIKIVKYNDYEMTLNIDGEDRVFRTHDYHLSDNPLEFVNDKFISEDTRYKISFNDDGYYYVTDDQIEVGHALNSECNKWNYKKGSNKIVLTCRGGSTRTIEIQEYKKNKLKLYFVELDENITFNKIDKD